MTRVVPFGDKLLTSRLLETLGRIQDIGTDSEIGADNVKWKMGCSGVS